MRDDWDFRLDTGISAYNPHERISRFTSHVIRPPSVRGRPICRVPAMLHIHADRQLV